ncbi:MAG: polyprenyl synthetase family protein [Bacteroidales bacterium]|nr:polyprenyl synthetase family protein [Bacteroidales bacterium]
MDSIRKYLETPLRDVEECISQALGSDIELLDHTNRLLLEGNGKMVRPILSLLCAGAAGTPGECTVRFAAATELLHNATLLHDDVVDGAAERRGRPTVAKLLGPSASVLIGDYWLVKCMQTILSCGSLGDRVLRLFAKTLEHLSEGELLQMQKASSADTTPEDYRRIIYCKTASLFETAARSAAISAGADEPTLEALCDYARNLGMAFQVKDDIMDYDASQAVIGKPVGTDLREQKITQPLLSALETVSPEEQRRIRGMVSHIADDPSLEAPVREFVLSHDGIARASAVLEEYLAKALECLEPLAGKPEKEYLAILARYIAKREN